MRGVKYSIGDMSKLFNITIGTLRHYHDRGIFEAGEVDEKSGYRYYYSSQFETLNNIINLKNSGLSLGEIKEVLSSKGKLKENLIKQRESIERKIKELEVIEKSLEERIEYLEGISKINDLESVIEYEEVEEEVIRLEEEFETEDELELLVRKIGKKEEFRYSLILGRVGLLMKVEESNHKKYSGIYLKTGRKNHKKTWLKIYFKGTRIESEKYYKKLKEYIRMNKIQVEEYYYEMALSLIDDRSEEKKYIRVIKIPKKQLTL